MEYDDDHALQGGGLVYQLQRHVHQLRSGWRRHPQPAQFDRVAAGDGQFHRFGERTAQSLARHGMEVPVGLARGGLEILPGAAADENHIAARVDDYRGRRMRLKYQVFGRRLQAVAGRIGAGGGGHGWYSFGFAEGCERGRQELVRSAGDILLTLIQPQLRIGGGEQPAQASDRFRTAEQQHGAGPHAVVKQGQQPALQGGVEVDHEIAAGQQVEPGERRIQQHVMVGE